MSWTAVIPLNAPALRKSRLAAALSPLFREALAEELYRHVAGCVEQTGIFDTVVTLSPALPPAGMSTKLWLQQGADLNAELALVRTQTSGPLLVLNADLPLLAADDLSALVRAAESSGCAIAADRHGTGTNAVALLPGAPLSFAFGVGSLAAHSSSAPRASVVRRAGLACDLDTPADIGHVLALERPPPDRVEALLYLAWTSGAARRMAHAS
jgi:2-phospho-L-lactate guanylyltransferase